MRAYVVYVDGVEARIIRAGSHCAAERKAARLYPGRSVSVAYTEI